MSEQEITVKSGLFPAIVSPEFVVFNDFDFDDLELSGDSCDGSNEVDGLKLGSFDGLNEFLPVFAAAMAEDWFSKSKIPTWNSDGLEDGSEEPEGLADFVGEVDGLREVVGGKV